MLEDKNTRMHLVNNKYLFVRFRFDQFMKKITKKMRFAMVVSSDSCVALFWFVFWVSTFPPASLSGAMKRIELP